MCNVNIFKDFTEKEGLDRDDWRTVAYFDESSLSLECKAKIRMNPDYEDNYYYLQNNEYADYVAEEHDFYSIRVSKLA